MADGDGFMSTNETDQYYLNVIKTLESLQSKLASGGLLTAEETDQLNTLSQEFENLRTGNPQKFNQLVGFINEARKSSGGSPGGDVGANLSNFVSSFSENINRNITTKSQTDQQTREYIDLPTPEEFLDDFTNAYNMHITGLEQSGAISPMVANFAREQQAEVFGQYLRKQTENLLKGEPLYKVVGANANEQLIGARQGNSFARQGNEQTQIEETSSRQESSTGTSGPSTTPAGQAVDQAGSSSGTSNVNQNTKTDEAINATEFLVSRNKLNYVSSLAPLDFLKEGANAQRLNFLYAGQKGTAQRAAQTAAGGEYAGARRI